MKTPFPFLSILRASALGVGAFLLAVSLAGQSPLVVPPVLTGPVYDLRMQLGSRVFVDGLETPTAGYNGDFLGPTLIMSKGDDVVLNVTNDIGETTTTH